jgi:two-component system chemotaxis response regulator CheB
LLVPVTEEPQQAASATLCIALAASAGGLTALSEVLSCLPADFAASLLVLQHLSPNGRSWLVEILRRRVRLAVTQVRGGELLVPGAIFVAPPNHHLLVRPGGILALSEASRVHFVRPSADLLFTSMAESLQSLAVAVVLSGSGKDGAQGVQDIKRHGGTVIVQDEATAEFDGMPGAARKTGVADRVLPLAEIAAALIELAAEGRT